MEPWPHRNYNGNSIRFIPSLMFNVFRPMEWRVNRPKFNGDPTLVVTHVNYMKYASRLDVLHEDVLMKICVSSLESSQRNFLAHSCNMKSIPYSTKLIFSSNIDQLPGICKIPSKSSKTFFAEKIFL
jgi:hypothetical protein